MIQKSPKDQDEKILPPTALPIGPGFSSGHRSSLYLFAVIIFEPEEQNDSLKMRHSVTHWWHKN
jgi:hypothetical protein